MTEVLIGIPTYNGYKRVDWLLQSIFMRTGNDIDYKIMICDDSGNKEHQEKTINVVEKWNANLPIDILVNDKNMGIAKSWNRIIKSEDSQYIILINDDIIVEKCWLDTMVYFLRNNPSAGAIFYDFIPIKEDEMSQFRKISNYQTTDESDDPYIDSHHSPIRCAHSIGCFFGFCRDKYDMVGGFDENYFANFEETDFCTALLSYGFPNYILRYPMCWHVYSATFKSAPELNYKDTLWKSGQYYIKKWNGDHRFNSFYLGSIPPRRIKWIYKNNIYEDIY